VDGYKRESDVRHSYSFKVTAKILVLKNGTKLFDFLFESG
jgi:hypothetical protein